MKSAQCSLVTLAALGFLSLTLGGCSSESNVSTSDQPSEYWPEAGSTGEGMRGGDSTGDHPALADTTPSTTYWPLAGTSGEGLGSGVEEPQAPTAVPAGTRLTPAGEIAPESPSHTYWPEAGSTGEALGSDSQ